MATTSSTGSTIQTSHEREGARLAHVRAKVLGDRAVLLAVAVAAGWLAMYAAATAGTAERPQARQLLGDVVYVVPVALAGVLSLRVARSATGRRRRLWWLLVASNALWLAGDLIWAGYAYLLHEEAPFPSVADVLYLASYVLVPAAVLVGFGGTSGRRRVRGLLDAGVVALGLGALGWQALIAPQVGSGLSPATLTGIAYPLLGLVIVVTLVTVGLGGHRQVAPSVWLVGAAFAVSAVTDAGYTWLSSLHDYVSGDWLDLGWQLEAVLLCLAAFIAQRHDEGDGQVAQLGRDLGMAPVLVGVVAALVLAGADGLSAGVPVATLVVAAAVVVALVTRSVLSVADSRRVALQLDAALREQERLAVTDGLTGLYNRRFFEEVLGLEADRAVRERGRLALLVADLDHFKRVNDQHGHQSGDAVLVEAADRLRRALRGSDVLARYGGEEFVMILPGADAETALEIAERCRLALRSGTIRLFSGTRITLTGSFGLACLAEGSSDVDALIRDADRALYAAKDAGRDRVLVSGQVVVDSAPEAVPGLAAPLLPLERLADLVDARLGTAGRSADRARWAGVLADALGLAPDRRELAIAAARLHDIGMIALSDTVLTAPGRLSEQQQALVRSHPAQGERLLRDVPGQDELAAMVRGHHERIDGTGYPDRVRAADLSLETRMVSVLDTWAALRADRPYARARSEEQARTELARVRGTQLDAAVVDTFLGLQAAGLVGDLRTASGARA